MILSKYGTDSIDETNITNQIKAGQAIIRTFMALTSRATPPQAHGDDIDVPFISMRRWRVHVGTGATAPPAALTQTPRSPSAVGPRLDLHHFQIISSNQTKNQNDSLFHFKSPVLIYSDEKVSNGCQNQQYAIWPKIGFFWKPEYNIPGIFKTFRRSLN